MLFPMDQNFVQDFRRMAVLFQVRRPFAKAILVVLYYATSTERSLSAACYQERRHMKIIVDRMVIPVFLLIFSITLNGFRKIIIDSLP